MWREASLDGWKCFWGQCFRRRGGARSHNSSPTIAIRLDLAWTCPQSVNNWITCGYDCLCFSVSYSMHNLFVYLCFVLQAYSTHTQTHALFPQPASRRMLWITLHLRLVRSQERTALARIRQQSESTLSFIISSACLSDPSSDLYLFTV